MAGAMLGPVVARLAREKAVGELEAPVGCPAGDPGSFSERLAVVASERRLSLLLCLSLRERTVSGLGSLCGFDRAIAAEDLELLGRHGIVRRSPDGGWRLCCPSLGPSVARLVDLVMTPAPKETHA
jgi:hypothetical protein